MANDTEGRGLVAVVVVAPAAASASPSTSTTKATAPTARRAVSATTRTAKAAPSTTTAAASSLALTRLVYAQGATVERAAIEGRYRVASVLVRCHDNERKPTRTSGLAIGDNADFLDLAAFRSERSAEGVLRGVVGEVADIKLGSHSDWAFLFTRRPLSKAHRKAIGANHPTSRSCTPRGRFFRAKTSAG